MDPAPPPEGETEGETEGDSEPKKPGVFSTLDSRAKRLMGIIGVVALAVGLLGGFAVGFKVEQNRVKSKPQKIVRVSGVVTDTASDAVTIADTQGLHVKVLTPGTVTVEKYVKGQVSDLHEGDDILLRGKNVSSGVVDASNIVVLPKGSKFGTLTVAKIDGNKITLDRPDNKPLTVNLIPKTAIYTTTSAKTSDITKDAEVVVRGSGVAGQASFTGVEIIILPKGSGFAS